MTDAPLSPDDGSATGARRGAALGFAVAGTATAGALAALPFECAAAPTAGLAALSLIAAIVLDRIAAFHPHRHFGLGNAVTLLRAAGTAVFVALALEPRLLRGSDAWAAFGLAVALLVLDGIDGQLARHQRLTSAFGARFDMETDALLVLALAAVAFGLGKAGPWVLAIGLMRYAFVGAGRLFPRLARPLPPSERRRAVCALQIAILALLLAPPLVPPLSPGLAALALCALAASFAADILYLLRVVPPESGPGRRVLAILVAVAVLWALLAFPNQPGVLTPAGLRRFPLELPLLVLVLAACPPRLARAVRGAVALALAATFALKLADLAAETAFQRPFNPVLDGNLVPAAFGLVRGAAGLPLALAAAALLAASVALVAGVAWWATGRLAGLVPPRRRPLAALLVLPALALVLLDAAGVADPPGYARTTQMAAEHVAAVAAARADLAAFRRDAAHDAWAEAPPADILPALRGTDVLVVFVESWGRTTLDDPLYRPTTTAALRDTETALAGAGLGARSGFLTAPMVGGESWLAHASLLSGLSIDNEGKYRALFGSDRRTLLHLAEAAGWQTAAVMPAITRAWPEADWFGYDRVLAAADLGYHGQPFGWVTMPDQYTFAALDRALLAATDRKPVMAEIASSLRMHRGPRCPRSCRPGPSATAASTPKRCARATRPKWSGATTTGFASSTVGRSTTAFAPWALLRRSRRGGPRLVVVLGDHQPAAFVSEGAGGRDVPVNVIGPPDLVARLDAWGWTPGMIPDPSVAARPMADFRDRFLAAFGGRQ